MNRTAAQYCEAIERNTPNEEPTDPGLIAEIAGSTLATNLIDSIQDRMLDHNERHHAVTAALLNLAKLPRRDRSTAGFAAILICYLEAALRPSRREEKTHPPNENGRGAGHTKAIKKHRSHTTNYQEHSHPGQTEFEAFADKSTTRSLTERLCAKDRTRRQTIVMESGEWHRVEQYALAMGVSK